MESSRAVLQPRISVVMPTLNEARNLPHVFARFPPDLHEVIVVDGQSTDGTPAVARGLLPSVHIVGQTRRGKGNALACGFAVATGDIIATLDADGSADPAELPRFVQALLDGADFAKGTRFAATGGSEDITRLRAGGNRMLSGLVNRYLGTCYTDLCYGYNVFWRRLVPVFGLAAGDPAGPGVPPRLGDGFEVEALMHVRAVQAGLRVVEVPSYEYRRLYGGSNLNAISDGIRVLRTIVRERRRTKPTRPVLVQASAAGATISAGIQAGLLEVAGAAHDEVSPGKAGAGIAL